MFLWKGLGAKLQWSTRIQEDPFTDKRAVQCDCGSTVFLLPQGETQRKGLFQLVLPLLWPLIVRLPDPTIWVACNRLRLHYLLKFKHTIWYNMIIIDVICDYVTWKNSISICKANPHTIARWINYEFTAWMKSAVNNVNISLVFDLARSLEKRRPTALWTAVISMDSTAWTQRIAFIQQKLLCLGWLLSHWGLRGEWKVTTVFIFGYFWLIETNMEMDKYWQDW